MPYIKRTNLFKQILFSRGMALFVLVLIVFVGYGVFSIVGKSLEASKERKTAEAQAATITAKQADLTAKLSELNTPEGQESALREQFPVVSPGERVVVINDGSDTTPAVATGVAEDSGPGFWNFLKNLFKSSPEQ